MTIPKRDDKCYREIEDFQSYEITNCIAYEMAIRTKPYKEYHRKLTDIITPMVKRFKAIHHYEVTEDKYTRDLFLSETDAWGEVKHRREYGTGDMEIIHGQQSRIEREVIHAYYDIGLNMLNELDNDLLVDFFTIPTRDGETWKVTATSLSAEDRGFLNNVSHKYAPKFSRPKMRFPNRATIQIDLGMKMSDTELIEYVEEARKQYQVSHSTPKNIEINSPLASVLGIKESKVNKMNHTKNLKKLADWFFVYDTVKEMSLKEIITIRKDSIQHKTVLTKELFPNSKENNIFEIDEVLGEHYNLEKSMPKYSPRIYQTRISTMEYYIDSLAYKTIIV